jgi:hypothetical protein
MSEGENRINIYGPKSDGAYWLELRLQGKIFVLHAFIDDTTVEHGPSLFGVAGFLFEKRGLQKFEAEWASKIASLSKPFRTSSCAGGWPPFRDWSRIERDLLLSDLARLIADTRDAGFVATVGMDDYKSYAAEDPIMATMFGSPYTLCLMPCIDSACNYLNEHYPGGGIVSLYRERHEQ